MTPIRMTQATALILRALATGHRHGFEIMEVTGLASGTVYPVLRRLEQEEAVESVWEPEGAQGVRKGPRRRLYALTPGGDRHAEQAARKLEETRRFLLGPDGWAGAGSGDPP